MKRLSIFLSLLLLLTLVISQATQTALAKEYESYPTFRQNEGFSLSECVFFGDSTTYGLFRYNAHNNGKFGKNYYTLQDSQIWTPKSGTFFLGNLLNCKVALSDLGEITLSDALHKKQPPTIIVTVGINGLAAWNKETFTKYYEKLITMIKTASPKTVIVLQSVYPIAEKARDTLPAFSNEKIDTVNTWIEALAVHHKLRYLNTANVLKDASGNLAECCHNGDGLHLSTEGFNRMLEYVDRTLS